MRIMHDRKYQISLLITFNIKLLIKIIPYYCPQNLVQFRKKLLSKVGCDNNRKYKT